MLLSLYFFSEYVNSCSKKAGSAKQVETSCIYSLTAQTCFRNLFFNLPLLRDFLQFSTASNDVLDDNFDWARYWLYSLAYTYHNLNENLVLKLIFPHFVIECETWGPLTSFITWKCFFRNQKNCSIIFFIARAFFSIDPPLKITASNAASTFLSLKALNYVSGSTYFIHVFFEGRRNYGAVFTWLNEAIVYVNNDLNIWLNSFFSSINPKAPKPGNNTQMPGMEKCNI